MEKFDLKCEICSGKFDANYNTPKVLSCGHTICSKCVDRMKDKNINKCPFDRKVLDFDESKIATNYYILSLIDTSISEVQSLVSTEESEAFELTAKPVVNNPGWKNTLDGFISNNILHTVESNGFIYCTDLVSGEWWFMYHNQFYGNFFFKANNKMFVIDQHGSLFQIFDRNYYVQIGKKNAWKHTSHVAVTSCENKFISLTVAGKLFETNLNNGKVKEITVSGMSSDNASKALKNVTMLVATPSGIVFSNKNGELYILNEDSYQIKLMKKDYLKAVESSSANSTHVYFFEKNSKTIQRTYVGVAAQPNRKNSSTEFTKKLREDIKVNLLDTEKFIDLSNITPTKLIADDERIVVIDTAGEIHTFDLITKQTKNYQCLFALRNCHVNSTVLVGDGDLLILDPIRLSLNKLNIVSGTEVIALHSTKFLNTIKHIFAANTKVYFIDVSGNLYSFNESEKKLTQIGNNGICKYISDFGVHKNYLLAIENGSLLRINLSDGNYVEIKHDQFKDYEYFYCDNSNLVFLNKDDSVNVYSLNVNSKEVEQLKKKASLSHQGISSHSAITFFRNQLIFYNKETMCIESLNIDNNSHSKLIDNFSEINLFVGNHDFLACIKRDSTIYKLYC